MALVPSRSDAARPWKRAPAPRWLLDRRHRNPMREVRHRPRGQTPVSPGLSPCGALRRRWHSGLGRALWPQGQRVSPLNSYCRRFTRTRTRHRPPRTRGLERAAPIDSDREQQARRLRSPRSPPEGQPRDRPRRSAPGPTAWLEPHRVREHQHRQVTSSCSPDSRRRWGRRRPDDRRCPSPYGLGGQARGSSSRRVRAGSRPWRPSISRRFRTPVAHDQSARGGRLVPRGFP